MPGPARTSHLSILRRALIAYVRRGLAVNDGLSGAAKAIARIPDRDIGGYTVRLPDPAKNLKAYRKYWGDPEAHHGTTAPGVVERMLREALRRTDELRPTTGDDVTPWELDRGLERLSADLEVLHHRVLLQISQGLHHLGRVGLGHTREVRSLLDGAIAVDRQVDGGLRSTAPRLVRSLAEATYRAGATGGEEVIDLVLGPRLNLEPGGPQDNHSSMFGGLLADDLATREWRTKVLTRHYLAGGCDFNQAATSIEGDLAGRGLQFDRDAAVPFGIETLLDLDRAAEAVTVYSEEQCTDLDAWFSSTARLVRLLMVTQQQESLVAAALESAANMDTPDAVTGGAEVDLLYQLHATKGATPEGLVAYWAAGSDPDCLGEWSMVESAELLVWALGRQGRHATAAEFARDTVQSVSRHSLTLADELRWRRLNNVAQSSGLRTQYSPDVERALGELRRALLRRPGPLPLRTMREIENLAEVVARPRP